MDSLTVYSRCCSHGYLQARKLVIEVKEKTGVTLKIKYLSYSSSKAEFDSHKISIDEATKDPIIMWAGIWHSKASRALDTVVVDRLCYLIKQESQAYE
jgi:hypothetical protein